MSALYIKYFQIILMTFSTHKCIGRIKDIDLQHRLKKTKIKETILFTVFIILIQIISFEMTAALPQSLGAFARKQKFK